MRKLLFSVSALALAAVLANPVAFAEDAKKPDAGKPDAAAPAPAKTEEPAKPKALTRSLSQPSSAGSRPMNDGGRTDDPIGGLPGNVQKGPEKP